MLRGALTLGGERRSGASNLCLHTCVQAQGPCCAHPIRGAYSTRSGCVSSDRREQPAHQGAAHDPPSCGRALLRPPICPSLTQYLSEGFYDSVYAKYTYWSLSWLFENLLLRHSPSRQVARSATEVYDESPPSFHRTDPSIRYNKHIYLSAA